MVTVLAGHLFYKQATSLHSGTQSIMVTVLADQQLYNSQGSKSQNGLYYASFTVHFYWC